MDFTCNIPVPKPREVGSPFKDFIVHELKKKKHASLS